MLGFGTMEGWTRADNLPERDCFHHTARQASLPGFLLAFKLLTSFYESNPNRTLQNSQHRILVVANANDFQFRPSRSSKGQIRCQNTTDKRSFTFHTSQGSFTRKAMLERVPCSLKSMAIVFLGASFFEE